MLHHDVISADGARPDSSLGLDVTLLSRHESWLLRFVFGLGNQVERLFFRLDDGNIVGQWAFWSDLSGGIPWKHNLDLDTQHSLTQQNVTCGGVDVVVAGVTRVNHQAIDELHRLCTLTTELSGNDDFASLGAGLHDETEHTIACTTNGETSDELVAE